jgi:hypothetical protein
VGDREADASPGEARRTWLEKLQRATQRARDDLGDSSDPIVKELGSDLEQLAARLQRELERAGHGDASSGIT